MSQVAACAGVENPLEVFERHARGGDEIGKTGMLRADEAPQEAEDQQADDEITRPDVGREQFVLGEVGYEKGAGKQPVEDPQQRIPDLNLILFVHGDRLPEHLCQTLYGPRITKSLMGQGAISPP